jgi:hypothetical protein
VILKDLKKNTDGTYSFDFVISEEENEYLVEFAIHQLIKEGIISLTTKTDQEFEFLSDDYEGTLQ